MSESGTESLHRRIAALEAEVARLRGTPAGQREAELRLITDALPVLVAYLDRDYTYRFNNRHYETWFGRGVETLVGRHAREVIGPEIFVPRRSDLGRALSRQGRPRPWAGQGQTVLAIDDEPTVRMRVTEVPKNFGYAASEAAGLTMLGSDVRLDLLVTDIGLPGGMNGRQMADAGRIVRPGLTPLTSSS